LVPLRAGILNPRPGSVTPGIMNETIAPAPFRVAALYRFCRLERFGELRAPLAAFCFWRAKASTERLPAPKRRLPN
jgi:UPF0176 protein